MKHHQWILLLAANLVLSVVTVSVIGVLGYLPVNGAALREYMMANPQLVEDMAKLLRSQRDRQQQAAQKRAIGLVGQEAFFDPRIAFVAGPPDAKKTLVEFYDYNCAYCRASASAVMKYFAAHKSDTRFAFIEFPIKGPQSVEAARAVLAARLQANKYPALHQALMNAEAVVTEATVYAEAKNAGFDVVRLRADARRPEISKALDESRALAKKIGVEGTPTFIINGQFRAGALDEALLKKFMNG